jgi:hypothetical protein
MKLNYYHPYDGITTEFMFNFDGLELNRISDFNSSEIDFIPFDGVRLSNLQGDEQINLFLNELKSNGSFQKGLESNNLPIVFYHEHETLDSMAYHTINNIVSKELNVDKKKIVILDANLLNRKNVLNFPLDIKIKQFKIEVNESNISKTKKFSFLNNRTRKLRVQILDKILTRYNNIELLRSENIITFRNFKENDDLNIPKGPSTDISSIEDFIEESKYYTFNNNFEFYNSIDLPWVIDDFNVGHEYNKMYEKQNYIYSTTCFSIITETENRWLDLDCNRNEKDYLPLTEKALVPLSYGNLPFIIHSSDYYNRLEDVGFDFSYLKTLFDIDYKTNTLKENFNCLDKFTKYFVENDFEKVKEDYYSFKTIIENNKRVLKDIQQNKYTENVSNFIEQLKNKKYE